MPTSEYVTQDECESRQKEVFKRFDGHEMRISSLEESNIETKVTLKALVSIGKATFAAVASGLVSIIVILLMRGI